MTISIDGNDLSYEADDYSDEYLRSLKRKLQAVDAQLSVLPTTSPLYASYTYERSIILTRIQEWTA